MKRDFYTKTDASKAVYWVLIMQIVVSFVFVLLTSQNLNLQSETENFFYLMLQYVVTEAVFIGVFAYYNSKKSIDGIKAVGVKKKTDIITILVCVAISVIVLFLTYHFFGYVDHLFELIGFKKSSDPFVLDSFYKFIISVFVLALWPAISEELIYRGIVLNGLAPKGKIKAILLSALFFSIMHMGVFQIAYQFYLAVIFAIVLIFTKDIKLSIIMHFINNFLVLLFSFLTSKYNITWFFGQTINFWLTLLMFLVCSAFICLFLYIIKKRNAKAIQEHATLNLTKKENLYANIGLAIALVIYLILGISNSLV